MRISSRSAAICLLLASIPAHALEYGAKDVYVRVVDVGPGLCTITEAPNKHFMVYDAGHWHGERCLKAVRELVPLGGTIDLLIISHSDADHMGDADKILKKFDVKQIIWTGFFRDKEFWKVVNEAIADEHEYAGASVLNLQSDDIELGTEFALGDATVTFVAGWPNWPDSQLSPSARRNAISIVVGLEYRGHSVLFTGDTVGRRTDDLPNACKDAEKIIVGRH